MSILYLSPNIELGHPGGKPFLSIPSFSLPAPGTYTLEGPNGSGKSMFIRLLTGTLPGGIDPGTAPEIQVDNRPIRLLSYRDALRSGIVAVFQDDDMISPMTVFENVLLRHGNNDRVELWNYTWRTSYNYLLSPAHHVLQVLGPALAPWTESLFKKIHPPSTDWRSRKELRKRSLELLRQHGVSTNILDEVPPRLSGGGRAAAKLVAAQLYKNTRVLLLDEPFNSVERNIWPSFLDSIKIWAEERGAAVLAVSHNPAELVRWDPRVRFEIRDGVLGEAETFAFGRKRRIPQMRQGSVPIFEHLSNDSDKRGEVWKALWQRLNPERCLIFVANRPRNTPFVRDLISHLPAGCRNAELDIPDSPRRPTLQDLDALSGLLREGGAVERTVVVAVGGRRAKAISTLAALNDLSLNLVGTVVALTSFCDSIEAIASAGLELSSTNAYDVRRKILVNGNFFPDSFVADLNYFAVDDTDLRIGLVYALRVGLLFEVDLFNKCCQALLNPAASADLLVRIYQSVLRLINETVDLDDGFMFRPVFGFGDVHAQCISELSNKKVNRAEALLLGMILEAGLGKSTSVVDSLEGLRKQLRIEFPAEVMEDSQWDILRDFHVRTGIGGTLRTLQVNSIGDFNITEVRRELTLTAPESTGLYNRDVGAYVHKKITLASRQSRYDELHNLLIQMRADLSKASA